MSQARPRCATSGGPVAVRGLSRHAEGPQGSSPAGGVIGTTQEREGASGCVVAAEISGIDRPSRGRGTIVTSRSSGTMAELGAGALARPQVRATWRGESACRPGSVHPLARADGHPSRTAVAGSLVRSTRGHRAGSPQSLAQSASKPADPLDLAPGGVYRAAAVTCGAGGLLHHRFTLTSVPDGTEAVCFLWHCPAGHPGSALPTTLPCGARTFLDGPRMVHRDRPADSPGPMIRPRRRVVARV